MADLLLLTSASGGSAQVLPALGLLSHRIRVLPVEPSALVDAPDADIVVLDARRDLAIARTTCRVLRASGLTVPLVLVLTEGGLTVVTAEWGADDIVLENATPVEVETRFRLVMERAAVKGVATEPQEIMAGELVIDPGGYSARLRGRPLDLTYKEFELIKYLVQHPGRVFTRAQLLQEVWGYDYYGGTRTVDVHVRRLRAKLGPEHEQLIGTVRNVGYRFDPPKDRRAAATRPTSSDPESGDPSESDPEIVGDTAALATDVPRTASVAGG
ncbi:MAG TPA: response regulator transcription factor [Cellulomonas sp.]|uniref:winged helix-turn-helix transcriptional regulator n=1 Tax=Cellulomonas sp. TaxID=40001 RepID=UPI002E30373F|nr:response regulator transcription factor [Cellulomonas sp.]HEX5332515.1 response regulator transcription factor [Cellulomonas sp.]